MGIGTFISVGNAAQSAFSAWRDNRLARQCIEDIFLGMLRENNGKFSPAQIDVTLSHLQFVTTLVGSSRPGDTFRVTVINTTLAATDRKYRRDFHYNTKTKQFDHK